MVVKQLNKCPPHHWMIDSYNIGHCTKEGCDAVKDFNELQNHEPKLLGLRSTIKGGTKNYSRSRGRPRKEEIFNE